VSTAGGSSALDRSSAPGAATVRRATPQEAGALTGLTVRSKAAWGYPDEFMSRAVDEMTISPEDVERDHVEVIESDGRVIGFYRLQRRGATAWLEDLFIEPDLLRSGWGRRLLARACEVAREWGAAELELESDPNAEAFYVHLGARRTGLVESRVVPGRQLPRMRLPL
jgi:GNAT superfamily N-acetyltransferase